MVETGYMQKLKSYLATIYSANAFVNLLDMSIVDIVPGKIVLSMPIKENKHTNLYNAVHGGALASLADTAMGIACVSTNAKVVTLDMNINFIKNVNAGSEVTATAAILHRGRQTIVVEADIFNEDKVLLAKSRGTFFVLSKFEDFPKQSA